MKFGKSYKAGCFVATAMVDGVHHSSKDGNINVHGTDVSFEIVDQWAIETAKELDVEYRRTPKSELMERLAAWDGDLSVSAQIVTELPIVKMWSTKNIFRANLKGALKLLGYERCVEMLNYGLAILEELNADNAKKQQDKADADKLMAEAMFNIYKLNNVCMAHSIKDSKILALYTEMKKAA